MAASRAMSSLLDRGGDAHELVGGDEVVVVVVAGVELDPFHGAGEMARFRRVVVADGGAGVAADVAGLVAGVDHRDGGVDPSFAGLGAVDVERGDAAFG